MNKNKKTGSTPERPRKVPAAFHPAAFSAIRYYLREYQESGDVTLKEEHPLSKQAPRIDIIVKKNRKVQIDRCWARIFRRHNIIEYKSPVDAPPSIYVFNKTVHGYAGLYSSQERVSLTDMSVSIVCFKKPVKLLETLEKRLGYEVLQKDGGIYYIVNRGIAPEKSLAVQIVVSSELPDSEFFLKNLKRGIDRAAAQRLAELDAGSCEHLHTWLVTMLRENKDYLFKEGYMKDTYAVLRDLADECGLTDDIRREGWQEAEQKGWQAGQREGWQEGSRNIIEFLRNGHTLEEAEKKFALH